MIIIHNHITIGTLNNIIEVRLRKRAHHMLFKFFMKTVLLQMAPISPLRGSVIKLREGLRRQLLLGPYKV